MASREQRLALAQAGMDAFNDRDMERMLAALTEDVEVFASPELVNSGEFRGHDGFTVWISSWIEAWEEISTEVTQNDVVGERHVVTTVHQEGRGRGGIEVSMEIAFLFDVDEDGRASYLAMVRTPAEARELAMSREGDG